MIDYSEAVEIALAHIGPECGLVEEATFEKPYGWYFLGQSKAYLRTRDINDMLFGSGGFIVERENGRIVVFGTAYPLETWIANYEKGFKYDRYNLVIVSVHNLRKTLNLLLQLDMTYVIPEVAYGIEWKVPQHYGRMQLFLLLRHLPVTFANQVFWHRMDVLDKIDACKCCTYELSEYSQGEGTAA